GVLGVPGEAGARLPLTQVVGDGRGAGDGGVGTGGLGIPLAVPAEAGGEGEVFFQRDAIIGVVRGTFHRALVLERSWRGSECFLVAAGIIGDEVGKRIEIVTAFEVGLLKLCRGIVGVTAAEMEEVAVPAPCKIVPEAVDEKHGPEAVGHEVAAIAGPLRQELIAGRTQGRGEIGVDPIALASERVAARFRGPDLRRTRIHIAVPNTVVGAFEGQRAAGAEQVIEAERERGGVVVADGLALLRCKLRRDWRSAGGLRLKGGVVGYVDEILLAADIEEELVFDERAADGCTEFVLGVAEGVAEGVPTGPSTGAEDIELLAVEAVAAFLGGDIEEATVGAAHIRVYAG